MYLFEHAEDKIRDYRVNMIIELIVMNVVTIIGAMYYRNLLKEHQKLKVYTATDQMI